MPHSWCPQEESNLYREIRNLAFYPLNYGDVFKITLRRRWESNPQAP